MTYVEPAALKPHVRLVAEGVQPGPNPELWARPFLWRDPRSIPPREHLYGTHYTRQFVSATMAPGAAGKSALALAEACAMASGRGLLGVLPADRLRVWYWNGEDPLEETERRLAGIMLHFGLEPADLERWLFIGSGREAELVIAEQTRDGAEVSAPNVAAVKAMLGERRIDVAIIDPFVSSHRVTENDNPAIDRVAKQWGKIADETRCAVELVHHTRKNGGGEITVEDGRGASALLYAARSARVLNFMTEEEAGLAGVERRRSHVRVDNGKANLAPPPERSDWFKIVGVDLGNGRGLFAGDSVGVVTSWSFPSAMDGVRDEHLAEVQRRVAAGSFRESVQAKDWVGNVIAAVVGVDPSTAGGKARAKSLLKAWLAKGALVIVPRQDPKGNMRPFIEVGEAAEQPSSPP